jgi:hypothetical protein
MQKSYRIVQQPVLIADRFRMQLFYAVQNGFLSLSDLVRYLYWVSFQQGMLV